MKAKKGLTIVGLLITLIIFTILAILGSIIVQMVRRTGEANPTPITYKGFIVRVRGDLTCCQKHLTIEDPNSGIFIFACNFRRNTDPNDRQFQAINRRYVSENHPLFKLATFEEIEKAYLHFRAEKIRREQEKSISYKRIHPQSGFRNNDPRKLTDGPVP